MLQHALSSWVRGTFNPGGGKHTASSRPPLSHNPLLNPSKEEEEGWTGYRAGTAPVRVHRAAKVFGARCADLPTLLASVGWAAVSRWRSGRGRKEDSGRAPDPPCRAPRWSPISELHSPGIRNMIEQMAHLTPGRDSPDQVPPR